MILQVRSYGHDYLIVPGELLEGVSTTEPPGGLADSWGQYDDFAEVSPDLVAEVARLRAECDPDPDQGHQPMRFPPGRFVIIEYLPKFGVWDIMTYEIFLDADDARGWLLDEAGPPDRFSEWIGDTVVLDRDMPLELRVLRADPGRAQ
jgi:hypothetical protein